MTGFLLRLRGRLWLWISGTTNPGAWLVVSRIVRLFTRANANAKEDKQKSGARRWPPQQHTSRAKDSGEITGFCKQHLPAAHGTLNVNHEKEQILHLALHAPLYIMESNIGFHTDEFNSHNTFLSNALFYSSVLELRPNHARIQSQGRFNDDFL